MGIRFNADEVFEMAERIEANGAAFYRRAAELQGGGQAAFLLGLAEMEDGHRATFASMRRGFAREMQEATAFDPYLEAALYLQGMADSHGGEGAPSVARSLKGTESLADILRIAIGMEQQSILFYLGLKDMVPARLGRDKVETIIAEEKAHLSTLTDEIRKLQAA
jgi:rubrerythrin